MNGVIVRVRPPRHPLTQAEAEDFAEIHIAQRTPEQGLCAAVLRGEVLGVFRTPAEAVAALDRRLAELGPLKHGDDAGSIVFLDAAYHVPIDGEHLNG